MPDSTHPSGPAAASPPQPQDPQPPSPPHYTSPQQGSEHTTPQPEVTPNNAAVDATNVGGYQDTEAPPPYPGPELPPYSTSYPAPPYPGPPPATTTAGPGAVASSYPAAAWNTNPNSEYPHHKEYPQYPQYPQCPQYPQYPPFRQPQPPGAHTTQPQSIHGQGDGEGLRGLVISTDAASRPSTWLALSVVTCLCFSPLFGLFAICFSMAAHTSYSAGDMEGARRNANVALALSFLGITLSIVMAIFIFTIY